MQPRRLGSLILFTSPDDPDVVPPAEIQFGEIKKFPGTRLLVQVVPDFEAIALGNSLIVVARAFGWEATFLTAPESKVQPTQILEGVMVTYTQRNLADAAQALATGLTKAGLTSPGISRVFAFGYPVMPDGTPSPNPARGRYPELTPPVDAVIVMIGMKPIPQP